MHESLLIVDDEKGILVMLENLLNQEGYTRISTATSGHQALQLVQTRTFDLIILDVMLPDIDGFDLCQQIRRITSAPILFLTARTGDLDKLTGLRIGGDDYITKPFNPLEVVARIHAQLRRQRLNRGRNMEQEILDFGTFVIHKSAGQLSVNGSEIHCTAKEFELLVFLCEHPNRIFTAQQLYEHVWGPSVLGDEKTVVIHISRLRKKIEKDPSHPTLIVNMRGLGYKFVPPRGC